MEKETVIVTNGNSYYTYMKIIGTLQFGLTEGEVRVAAEMLRRYERYLSQSNSFIAWELLNTPKNNKEIKNLLSLKDASYNNLKLSLKKKGIFTDEGFNKNLFLSNIKFVINDTTTTQQTIEQTISTSTSEYDSEDDYSELSESENFNEDGG